MGGKRRAVVAKCVPREFARMIPVASLTYFQDTDYELAVSTVGQLPIRSVLDVGAEAGSFVEACLSRGCSPVFAFEPYPPHIQTLRDRFSSSQDVQIFD